MTLSTKAQSIYDQISNESTKLGDLRKLAKEIKKDHDLAMELWSTNSFYPRQLAILIMDKNLISEALFHELDKGIQNHEYDERNQLTDWLMANQMVKRKKNIPLIESWENSPSVIQRRMFWYYQARLRWTGKTPPPNSEALVSSIELNIVGEKPEVQWAMNFTAGQIGIHEPEFRNRCIAIGENSGLYKDEKFSKGCTPNYLPEFIRIEAEKWEK